MSATFGNETRNSSLDHRVEPVSDLNPIDRFNGGFGNLRDVVVLVYSLRSFRGGKDGRATLNRPREQDLRGGQRGLPGNGQNGRIFQRARPYPMTQWRKGQKNNAL